MVTFKGSLMGGASLWPWLHDSLLIKVLTFSVKEGIFFFVWPKLFTSSLHFLCVFLVVVVGLGGGGSVNFVLHHFPHCFGPSLLRGSRFCVCFSSDIKTGCWTLVNCGVGSCLISSFDKSWFSCCWSKQQKLAIFDVCFEWYVILIAICDSHCVHTDVLVVWGWNMCPWLFVLCVAECVLGFFSLLSPWLAHCTGNRSDVDDTVSLL